MMRKLNNKSGKNQGRISLLPLSVLKQFASPKESKYWS